MGGCQTGGDAEGVAASRGSDIYLSEQQSQEAKNYGYWCFPVLTRECRPDGAGGFLISMHLFLRQEVLQYWVCNMLRRARPRQFCQNVLPRLVCRELLITAQLRQRERCRARAPALRSRTGE